MSELFYSIEVLFDILGEKINKNKNKKHGKVFEIIIITLLIIGIIALLTGLIFVIIKLLQAKQKDVLMLIAFFLGFILIFTLYLIITSIKDNYEIYKIKKQLKEDKHD